MKLFRKYSRFITATLLFLFVTEIFFPSVAWAVTGHTSMPEYRSFEPVSTDNMVNPLTGDFTYNLPLLDIPNGYPINISYHQGDVNNEAQSSWVGLGWTLNPGAINRTKRGFPDEFDGNQIKYFTKMPANWTATAGTGAGAEAFGFGVRVNGSVRYNNYKGFGRTFGLSIDYAKALNLSFNYEAGRWKISPSVNPMALAAAIYKGVKGKKSADPASVFETQETVKAAQNNFAQHTADFESKVKSFDPPAIVGNTLKDYITSLPGQINVSPLGAVNLPTSVPRYTGLDLDMRFEAGANIPPTAVDLDGFVRGNYTAQFYESGVTQKAYGYFNLENRSSSDMMDYYTELDSPYEKRDRFLGMPVANQDYFSITGEGTGGSFRAYRSDLGHFTKEHASSSTISASVGGDISLMPIVSILPPSPIGIVDLVATAGGNVGGGYSEINVGDWDGSLQQQSIKDANFKSNSYFNKKSNEKVLFRMAGDNVGNFEQSTSDDAVQAPLDNSYMSSNVGLPNTLQNVESRTQRSSYIKVNFNSDFKLKAGANNISYKVNSKTMYVKNDGGWADYNIYGRNTNTEIGEIVSTNPSGVVYTFGLPLRSKNERELQYSVNGQIDAFQGQYLVATPKAGNNIEAASAYKTGYESSSAYATQFLLTQITNPDYLDRTMDGPTPDDFGSYTRFNYEAATGGNVSGVFSPDKDWYLNRAPYAGLSFNPGSLSDSRDDMGSYFSSEKELYYLQSIASKTHVAVFTTSTRSDGFGASNNNVSGGGSGKTLKKLDKIELYSIKDCDEVINNNGVRTGVFMPKTNVVVVPIKTVHFDYDYSLCQGIPNTSNGSNPYSYPDGYGKLTLKRIWFEYEGKVKTKISPYIFEYAYPTTPYPTVYNGLSMGSTYTAGQQNPNYNVLNSDSWGNYRDFGLVSNSLGALVNFFPFAYQKSLKATGVDEDPAAWCLKVIKLPSGGEIHVQYEKNDYQYVQDKRAMVMVPLHPSTAHKETTPYYLDLDKAGIPFAGLTDAEKQKLLDDMFEPMQAGKENNKMYFNFLYSLVGDRSPDYKTINSEQIDGYHRVRGYGFNGDKAYYTMSNPIISGTPPGTFTAINHSGKESSIEAPRKVCEEFYNNTRQGLITDDGNYIQDGDKNSSFLNSIYSRAKQIAGVSQKCVQIDPAMSFVRLQLPKKLSDTKKFAKKGGGVRVKRLLTYDIGMSESVDTDDVLYGTEYLYQQEDGTSSGVATSEPGVSRKESPFTNPLPRDSQSWLDAIMYGEDLQNNEGPIGASLLPAPSIAYSRVVMQDIHKGSTSDGSEVQEFYTCKDFPMVVRSTGVIKRNEFPTGGGVISSPYMRVSPHMTQGYVCISNDMHGKVKRIAKYPANSNASIFEETYEYYGVGEAVNLMDEYRNVVPGVVGKQNEVVMESKEVNEFSTGGSLGLDITGGVFITIFTPPIVPVMTFPSWYLSSVEPYAFYHENILRTHVTNKIINYITLPKKVTTKTDGITHVTENYAFDKYSSTPVITRSRDDFDKPYTNYNFMASWQYPNLSNMSGNDNLFASANISADPISASIKWLSFTSGNSCADFAKFTKGDFLEIFGSSDYSGIALGLYHVSDIDKVNSKVKLVPSTLNPGTGSFTAGIDYNIHILKSARSNQLDTKIGNMVTYSSTALSPQTPPAINADITALLTKLNQNVNGGTIPKASLPSGLCVSGCNGDAANGFCDDIVIAKDGNTLKLDIGKTTAPTIEVVGTPQNPHPLVKTLNDWADASWGKKIAQPLTSNYRTSNTSTNKYYFGQYFKASAPEVQAISNSFNSLAFQYVNGNNNAQQLSSLIGLYLDDPGNWTFNCFSNANFLAFNLNLQNASTPPPGEFQISSLYFSVLPYSNGDYFGYFVHGNSPVGTSTSLFQSVCSRLCISGSSANGSEVCESLSGYKSEINKHFYKNGNVGGSPVVFSKDRGSFREDADGYLTFYLWESATPPARINGIRFYKTVSSVPSCSSVLNNSSNSTNSFTYNAETGYVQYNNGVNCAQNVSCLKICNPVTPIKVSVADVISASAGTFSDDWSYNDAEYANYRTTDLSNLNDYEKGKKGKWRLQSSYTYRTALDAGVDANGVARNKDAGKMKDFTLFDWEKPTNNDPNKWVLTNKVTKYSPHSVPVEDVNALNIYSSATYGYNNTLLTSVSQNAQAGTTFYEAFENKYGSSYLDNGYSVNAGVWGGINNTTAHTGKSSYKFTAKDTYYTFGQLSKVTTDGVCRVWIRADRNQEKLKDLVYMQGSSKSIAAEYKMRYVSGAGQWMLFEANYSSQWDSSPMDVAFKIKTASPVPVDFGDIYLDDVRCQPVSSEMVCYVYDKSQRIVASLDDRHYALIYQYNAEGMLVRKLKETVEGVKTISETQYNYRGVTR